MYVALFLGQVLQLSYCYADWYPEIHNGDEKVKADAIRIGQYPDGTFPTDSKEFAKRIFYTVFMGTENR